MILLNLTEGYTPIGHKHHEIKYKYFVFTGGEPHIKLDTTTITENHVIITIRISMFNDIGKLMVAVNALQNELGSGVEIDLFLAYFPGARQDRLMIPGEPLTIKIYSELINNLNFNKVYILDPHSEVTPALINNCEVIDNTNLVRCSITYVGATPYNIVSPDAGANKKIKDLVKKLSNTDDFTLDDRVIKCDKSRDVKTGLLSGFEVYADNLGGRTTFIVDDICDGGGTFIGLAEELKKKNVGDLYLIVSHGIFSQGFKKLRQHFKGIFTTDSIVNNYAWDIPEIEKGSEIVNIIKLKDII